MDDELKPTLFDEQLQSKELQILKNLNSLSAGTPAEESRNFCQNLRVAEDNTLF